MLLWQTCRLKSLSNAVHKITELTVDRDKPRVYMETIHHLKRAPITFETHERWPTEISEYKELDLENEQGLVNCQLPTIY